MTINVKLNFQRFIDLVTLVSTFVLVSPKLLRPSFKILVRIYPFITYCYSFFSIVFITFVFFIKTSLLHCLPTIICRASTFNFKLFYCGTELNIFFLFAKVKLLILLLIKLPQSLHLSRLYELTVVTYDLPVSAIF